MFEPNMFANHPRALLNVQREILKYFGVCDLRLDSGEFFSGSGMQLGYVVQDAVAFDIIDSTGDRGDVLVARVTK